MSIFFKIFGLFIAVGRQFGNCFAPALVLEWYGVRRRVSSHARVNPPAGASAALVKRIEARLAEALAQPETFRYPAWAKFTIRTRSRAETVIYWRGWFRFDWNSEHIAQRFGKCEDHSNYGGPVEFYSYRGILGTHQAL